MTDSVEDIAVEPGQRDVSPLAAPGPKAGPAAEVIVLYARAVHRAGARCNLRGGHRRIMDQRVHGDARRKHPQAGSMGSHRRCLRTDPAGGARKRPSTARRSGEHRPRRSARDRIVLRVVRSGPARRTGTVRAPHRDDLGIIGGAIWAGSLARCGTTATSRGVTTLFMERSRRT